MSDNLKDKFSNEDDFDNFKKSFDDYKNKQGMFEPGYAAMKLQELIYSNLVLQKKKFFRIPDDLTGTKNMALYMFSIKKLSEFEGIVSIFLN